ISPGINEVDTFYVRKIDDHTIKLFNNLSDATASDQTVTPSLGVAGDRITVSGPGFLDGTAVTYHTDAPAEFSSSAVDVTVGGDHTISGNDPNADNIYLGTPINGDPTNIAQQHFVNGEKVIYHVEPGKAAIDDLSDGGVYFIVNAGPYAVQLANAPGGS